jgi:enoyl-[acyl-carrier-protein] reductase (NADH)
MEKLLSERFEQELDGVLSCYDRIVITGNVQSLCYAQGMTHYLYQQGIRIFDYANFAEPLRERIRENAEKLADANNVKIEFIRKKDFRKETCIQKILKVRGEQPGLVHIFGSLQFVSSLA